MYESCYSPQAILRPCSHFLYKVNSQPAHLYLTGDPLQTVNNNSLISNLFISASPFQHEVKHRTGRHEANICIGYVVCPFSHTLSHSHGHCDLPSSKIGGSTSSSQPSSSFTSLSSLTPRLRSPSTSKPPTMSLCTARHFKMHTTGSHRHMTISPFLVPYPEPLLALWSWQDSDSPSSTLSASTMPKPL